MNLPLAGSLSPLCWSNASRRWLSLRSEIGGLGRGWEWYLLRHCASDHQLAAFELSFNIITFIYQNLECGGTIGWVVTLTGFSWEVWVAAFRRKVLGKLWSGHPIVLVIWRIYWHGEIWSCIQKSIFVRYDVEIPISNGNLLQRWLICWCLVSCYSDQYSQ